ncbi:MAG: CPBP family glutamic-type intramembrane protease [Puniceicoccaceae bacterium]
MFDSPLMILVFCAAALYCLKIWREDYLSARRGSPNPRALPGATGVPAIAIWVGVIGAILLVLLETAGEIHLGVSSQQTTIPAIALLSMLAAGIIEEIIFRGYIIIDKRGTNMLIASAMVFSLIFALLHYQYYTEIPEDGNWRDMSLVIDSKSLWSLFLLYLNSLWFYTVRFFRLNPQHSLLPCFAAHIASNFAVFMVKLAQGHVVGWW